MNISSWRVDDHAWLALRKQQLPTYLEFVKSHYPGDAVRDPDEYLRRARDYYFEGTLEGGYKDGMNHLDISDYFVMHPCLDLAAAQEIIEFYDRVGCTTRGYFGQYYLIPKLFGPLINQGMLSASIGEVVIEAFYGHSYHEASELRGFSAEHDAVVAGYNMCRELASWMHLPEHCEFYPANRLIDLAVGALEYYSASDLAENSYYVKSLSKRIARASEENDLNHMLRDFSEYFLNRIMNSKVTNELKATFG